MIKTFLITLIAIISLQAFATGEIQSVSTSNTAFLGVFASVKKQSGRLARVLQKVSLKSYNDYLNLFRRVQYNENLSQKVKAQLYLQESVRLFFLNGGKKLTIYNIKDLTDLGVSKALELTKRDRDLNLLVIPGLVELNEALSIRVHQMMINLAHKITNRFVILDSPNSSDINDLVNYKNHFITDRGAIYSSWIKVAVGSSDIELPITGAIAGLYARTDSRRGVWKAPAGTSAGIIGAKGAVHTFDDSELSENQINSIKNFSNSTTVWGSRTLSQNPEYRYIPVMRTKMMLEESINRGLDWVSFEPNNSNTWATVRINVTSFLQNNFRKGAFQGVKPEDAYFVYCGLGQTMTQNDLNSGKLIVNFGVALLRPAEFTISTIEKKSL